MGAQRVPSQHCYLMLCNMASHRLNYNRFTLWTSMWPYTFLSMPISGLNYSQQLHIQLSLSPMASFLLFVTLYSTTSLIGMFNYNIQQWARIRLWFTRPNSQCAPNVQTLSLSTTLAYSFFGFSPDDHSRVFPHFHHLLRPQILLKLISQLDIVHSSTQFSLSMLLFFNHCLSDGIDCSLIHSFSYPSIFILQFFNTHLFNCIHNFSLN